MRSTGSRLLRKTAAAARLYDHEYLNRRDFTNNGEYFSHGGRALDELGAYCTDHCWLGEAVQMASMSAA